MTQSAAAKAAKQAVQKVDEEVKTSKGRKAKVVQPLTAEHKKALTGLDNWSKKMRYLHQQGFTTSNIAHHLGKRYQHVRNVLATPLTGKK